MLAANTIQTQEGILQEREIAMSTEIIDGILDAIRWPRERREGVRAAIRLYVESEPDENGRIEASDFKYGLKLSSEDSGQADTEEEKQRQTQRIKKLGQRERRAQIETQRQMGITLFEYLPANRVETSDGNFRFEVTRIKPRILKVAAYIVRSARASALWSTRPERAIRRAISQHLHHLRTSKPQPVPKSNKPAARPKDDFAKLQRHVAGIERIAKRAGVSPDVLVNSLLSEQGKKEGQGQKRTPSPQQIHTHTGEVAKTRPDLEVVAPMKQERIEQPESPIEPAGLIELDLLEAGEIIASGKIPESRREWVIEQFNRITAEALAETAVPVQSDDVLYSCIRDNSISDTLEASEGTDTSNSLVNEHVATGGNDLEPPEVADFEVEDSEGNRAWASFEVERFEPDPGEAGPELPPLPDEPELADDLSAVSQFVDQPAVDLNKRITNYREVVQYTSHIIPGEYQSDCYEFLKQLYPGRTEFTVGEMIAAWQGMTKRERKEDKQYGV